MKNVAIYLLLIYTQPLFNLLRSPSLTFESSVCPSGQH